MSGGEEGGSPRYEVVHCDVGNANAAIVRFRENTVLIDGDSGPSSGIGGNIETVKVKLRNEDSGYERIDAVIGTHYDQDHQQGLQHILQDDKIDIGRVYAPNPDLYDDSDVKRLEDVDNDEVDTFLAEAKRQNYQNGKNLFEVNSRETIGSEEAQIDIRFPSEDYEGIEITDDGISGAADKNDGLVIKATYRGEDFDHSTVFLGDAETTELAALDEEFLAAETIVVSHHGSKTNLDVRVENISEQTLERLGFETDTTPSPGAVERAIETREDILVVAGDLSSAVLETADPDHIVISAHPDGYRQPGYSGHPDELTLAAIEGSDIDPTLHYTQAHGVVREQADPAGIDTRRSYRLPDQATDVIDARLHEETLEFQTASLEYESDHSRESEGPDWEAITPDVDATEWSGTENSPGDFGPSI